MIKRTGSVYTLAFLFGLSACSDGTKRPTNEPEEMGGAGGAATGGSGGSGRGGTGGRGSGGSGGASADAGGRDAAIPDVQPPDAAMPDVLTRGPVGDPLLDDFEDCDTAIAPVDGRSGGWYRYVDSMGSTLMPPTFMPAPGGRPGNAACGLAVKGKIFIDQDMMKFGWAGNGFGFADNAVVDASGYDGIRFWAKGSGSVRLSIRTVPVQDEKGGGTCKDMCGDYHGAVVEVGPGWQRHVVTWGELTQGGWGAAADFDPRQMRGLQFEFMAGVTFDLVIDDVAFVPPGDPGADAGLPDAGASDVRAGDGPRGH